MRDFRIWCFICLVLAPRMALSANTIDAAELSALIRSTVTALAHATMTGNYTVLRDLGGPDFYRNNDAAKLASAFEGLRGGVLDPNRIQLIAPVLVRPPGRDAAGKLHLLGYLDTGPRKLRFRLVFVPDGPGWKLYGIGVDFDRVTAQPNRATASDVSQELRLAPLN